ncbi:MAG TPA: methionyl-tRNA formyltransferase, partial [Sphingomicrobium sp.]|nr:methionyl-tRNA formyltransferase [Sphingomicrobium sp.]
MRIVFMGSPDFAVPSLNALIEAGHEVVAVYAQPPRPAGRGKADRKTSVHERAEQLGIEVRTPRTLRDPDEQARFRALDADLGVVAAYGLILPKPILEAPKGGCINVHASLLPRWRGAAPIQRAILAGDKETGVTIMQMEEGLDTGPMLLAEKTACVGKSAGYLERELAGVGAKLLLRYLRDPSAFAPAAQPEEGVTYAHKISKEEYRIDFRNTGQFIDRQIEAFNPPGAYFEYAGERIRILRAEWQRGSGTPGE